MNAPTLFSLLACLAVPGISRVFAAESADWPQFRGPSAAGVSANTSLPDKWSATENVAWKTDLPGRGWSSPIVRGRKIFLTAAIKDGGEMEAAKKGLYLGGERPAPGDPHRWIVYCLDLDSGKIVWEKEAHRGVLQHGYHVKNSPASETPVSDGQRVYAYFGNVGLFCFDIEGKLLWSKKWESFPTMFGWGTAASPVLHGERIYVLNDNDKQSFLVALDKKTGEQIWRVERDEKSTWATPFIWENGKRTEIVTPGKRAVRSYDLDGKLLWSFSGMSNLVIPTPLASDGLLFVSSGYVGDKLRPLYAIRPGASGDITLKPGETSNEFIAWSLPTGGPYNPSPLFYDGRLYVLYDRGQLSCLDAKTGKVLYDRQRLPNGNAFTTSPWAVAGRVFCLSEDGVCYALRAGDKFEVLHTNKLADDDMCMATPALAGDRLLIRTAARMYCIRAKERIGQ